METLEIREVESCLEESFRPVGFESNEYTFALSMYTKSFDPENRWTTAELFETPNQSTFSRYIDLYRKLETWQYFLGPLLALYTLLTLTLIEFRISIILLIMPLVASCYYTELRRILFGIEPFFFAGILYDSMQIFAPWVHSVNPPHVEEPYNIEKKLFGIKTQNGVLLTLSEYFRENYTLELDLLCAFACFCFIYEIILMAAFLYERDRSALRRFSWSFFLTNLLCILTFYLLPTAPPWYVMKYGTGPVQLDVPPSPARLSAVDAFLGIPYFQVIYSFSSNIFTAIPSLQASHSLLVWFMSRNQSPWLNGCFLTFAILMGFSSVYMCHHYVIDVLVGYIYTTASFLLVSGICDLVEVKDIEDQNLKKQFEYTLNQWQIN